MDPRDFVYTDGSQVKGNPTLGAGVVNPRRNSITHIDIKSQPEQNTINRADLAAIAVALKQENTEDHMSILTDSSFYINTIRNYTIDPAAYNHHLHKDLLQLTNQLLKDRPQTTQNTYRESEITYGRGIQRNGRQSGKSGCGRRPHTGHHIRRSGLTIRGAMHMATDKTQPE
jgi:ribonuclease HI